MSIRVLHILSGDVWGGTVAQLLPQIIALRDLGVDAQVILLNDGESARRFRNTGLPPTIIPESESFITILKRLCERVRKDKIEIIVSHGYKENILAALCALRCSIQCVATYHGITESYTGFRELKYRCYTVLEKLLVQNVAVKLVAVNRYVAVGRNLSKSGKLRIIHNVAMLDQTAAPLPEELQHPAIFLVGRLVRVKRVDRAFKSFNKVRISNGQSPPNLYCLGDGPDEAALKSLRESLPAHDRIHFLGYRSDASALLRLGDLFLLTSDSEGLPTVIIEAMLSGLPIVSVDLPGIREVFERFPNYPVRLTPPDEQSIANAIEEMLHQPKLDPKSPVMREVAQYFSPGRAGGEHLNLYRDILTHLQSTK